jgi:hypothetical protein
MEKFRRTQSALAAIMIYDITMSFSSFSFLPTWTFITYLQKQHVRDLILYQAAHTQYHNRLLHWILATILRHLFDNSSSNNKNHATSTRSSSDLIVHALGWTMGITSLLLGSTAPEAATTPAAATISISTTSINSQSRHPTHLLAIGIAACGIYIILAAAGLYSVQCCCTGSTKMSLMYATTVWTVAWILQVGIGHYCWEGNQPNVVANINEVSILAVMTSILIAWKS